MNSVDARRILIVDDDDCVREGMQMTLEVAGHRVRSTGSGREALRWLENEACDLLIVDFSMAEMDGPELYRRVLARWPSRAPRVLFVSGYSQIARDANDPDVLAGLLLVKPFALGELLATVQRALVTPAPSQMLIEASPWNS